MTLYEASGGYERLLEMTSAFYAKALDDDLIGGMFSKVASEHARYLAGWLSASFGGPADYLLERGDLRFVIWKHAGLRISDAQRARWARLMLDAAAEVEMPDTFMRSYERFVDSITRSVRENSNTDMEIMRAELGLAPDEDLLPLKHRS